MWPREGTLISNLTSKDQLSPTSSAELHVLCIFLILTCALDGLHKLDNLINIRREWQYFCDVGVAIAVVSVGYDCNANARNLLLKTFHGVSNVPSDLQGLRESMILRQRKLHVMT